jgi:hypothetical protein
LTKDLTYGIINYKLKGDGRMKKYTKKYMGYTFIVTGSRSEGYEIGYKGYHVGDADTLKEAEEVIQQAVGNGIGDRQISEL